MLFVLMYLNLGEGLRPDVDLILEGVGGANLPPLSFNPDDGSRVHHAPSQLARAAARGRARRHGVSHLARADGPWPPADARRGPPGGRARPERAQGLPDAEPDRELPPDARHDVRRARLAPRRARARDRRGLARRTTTSCSTTWGSSTAATACSSRPCAPSAAPTRSIPGKSPAPRSPALPSGRAEVEAEIAERDRLIAELARAAGPCGDGTRSRSGWRSAVASRLLARGHGTWARGFTLP